MKKSDIEVYYGNKEQIVQGREPYSEEVLEFLDELSKCLLHDNVARKYQDIVAFAFWIRKSNLEERKKIFYQSFEGQNVAPVGRGLVFHIAPSNVPINFAYSFVWGLLAGNSNIVKVSNKNFEQVPIICNLMKKLSNVEKYHWVEQCNKVVSYNYLEHDYSKEFSEKCDVRIVWGGDDTVSFLRNYKLKPRAVEITFADRYSLAMIDSKKLRNADEKEWKTLVHKFYNDTYLMDQNACSSPQLVCWIGDEESSRIVQKKFWEYLFFEVKDKYDLEEVKVSEKYTMLCETVANMKMICNVERFENYLYVANMSKLPEQLSKLKGRFGLFFQYQTADIDDILTNIDDKVQTVSVYGIDKKFLMEQIIEKKISGIDRIVSIGETLDIEVIWDGYDVIRQMSRCVWFN